MCSCSGHMPASLTAGLIMGLSKARDTDASKLGPSDHPQGSLHTLDHIGQARWHEGAVGVLIAYSTSVLLAAVARLGYFDANQASALLVWLCSPS